MSETKTGFSTKIGFILAAAGSAVGLGNIWRFPYLAAKYGGGIFLLVYLILTVTFGFTLMLTEISIGRKTGKSVIGAYTQIDKKFAPLGILAAAVPIVIFPYYCVIGGWIIKYFTVFVTGEVQTITDSSGFFGNFIGNMGQPTLFLAIYMIFNAIVVLLGVEKGIEKVSKFIMPVLIAMSLFIAVYSLTLDGAMDGLIYYIKPDFSNFSIKTVIAAMGQLFYSLSLAMGIMVTYGSYMRKEDSLEASVRQIEVFDTAVAFLAGLMIIPAVFAFSGGDQSALGAGPSLMFVTLPNVFNSMAGGRVIGIVFFLLVLFAALTSSISLMETIVSIVTEKTKLKRTSACIIIAVASFFVGMLSVLGYSEWAEFTLFGKQLLDFFDFLSNNIMMPIVALLTCILIGYIVKPEYIEEEVESNAPFKSKTLFRVMIKYIAPVCMIIIFFSSIFGVV